MFASDSPDYFVLGEIEKIIRGRWRVIERTTKYGWLIACSRGRSISREDARVLSCLARKIGYENCEEAFRRIRKACDASTHPDSVPGIAIAVFDEMYTLFILRKRGRESKWRSSLPRNAPPAVFTISNGAI